MCQYWRSRTCMEQCIIATTILFFIIAVLMASIVVHILHNDNEKEFNENELRSYIASRSCATPSCSYAASAFDKWMDTTVDPCYNFYQYACGHFDDEAVIPPDRSSVSTKYFAQEMVTKNLELAIKKIAATDIKPFQLVKRLYEACMEKAAIEKEGLGRIRAILRSLGGWPVLQGNNWTQENFDWKTALLGLKKNGLSFQHFFSVTVQTNPKMSTRRIIVLNAPSFDILQREFLLMGLSNLLVKSYHNFMLEIVEIFGVSRRRALLEGQLLELIKFEIELAKISEASKSQEDILIFGNPITIAALEKKFPNFSFLQFINNLLAPDAQLHENEEVIVFSFDYFKKFEALIEKTDKRVQANYVMWKAVAECVPYLNQDAKNKLSNYLQQLEGVAKYSDRDKADECTEICTDKLHTAVDTLYIREYFTKKKKKQVSDILSYIIEAFGQTLEEAKWISDPIKAKMAEKRAAMHTQVVYPDELIDDEKVAEFYKDLELGKGSYLTLVLQVNHWKTRLDHKLLKESVNRTDWISDQQVTSLDIVYSYLHNRLYIPAGILQGYFYDMERPNYLNFGAIGSMISRQFLRAFDDEGAQFDKNGNLGKWWTADVEKEFSRRIKCFVDQYGNYSISTINRSIDGFKTRRENVADNGGFEQAYRAYQNFIRKHKPEKILSTSVRFTANQMFWIAAAHSMCEKYTYHRLLSGILADKPFVPSYFRIIGSFSNSDFFARAFECPLGSYMNRKPKCKIW